MKLYLAVSSPPGASSVRADSIAPAIADVVFPDKAGPWHRHAWTSPDELTQLVGWSNEPDEEDDRFLPLLLADRDAALGIPGYVAPGTQVRHALDAARVTEVDDWSGVFGLFRADEAGFHALTTACRIHPVFHGAAGGHVVAGNRALLVHAVLRAIESGEGAAPRYDAAALEALVRSGYFFGDDTPFAGVQALPAHSTLRAQRGKTTVTVRRLPEARAGSQREQVDELAEALLAAAAPLAQFSEPIRTTLTGGRDSRLVAAVLGAAGVPFSTMTSGFAHHPDVVLATRVASLLGVPHKASPPKRDASGQALVVPHPLVRTRSLLRATEGMISALYKVSPLGRFNPAPRLGGAGGEQLRGGFLIKLQRLVEANARDKMDRMLTAGGDVLTDVARERGNARLRAWKERDPFDALDLLYLYDRSGRWAAPGRAVSRHGHATFELLARLAPALRDVPLIGRRWKFDDRWGWFRPGWRARTPLPVPDARAVGFDWRDPDGPPLRPIFREQILGGPAALFDVIDRTRVEALLSRKKMARPLGHQLWHIYTASVLLAGDWLGPQPVLDPIAIPLPKRLRRSAG